MKLSRPSEAWSVLTAVRPRPVKPSIVKVETPIALNVLVHGSMLAPMPPEPCISTTTGSRPVPCAIRNSPVVMTGLPLASPLRNCWSDSVSEGNACNSTRAAASFGFACACDGERVSRFAPHSKAAAMAVRTVVLIGSSLFFVIAPRWICRRVERGARLKSIYVVFAAGPMRPRWVKPNPARYFRP